MKEKIRRSCALCGAKFEVKTDLNKKRFCSAKHRNKSWREKLKRIYEEYKNK